MGFLSGFSFARWWLLLLLVLPVLLGVWEVVRRGHPLVLPFDHGSGARNARGPVLRVLVTLFNLTPPLLLAVAVVVLAGPRRLRGTEQERELSNILIALDVSASMESPFPGASGKGSCYDAAMDAVKEFTSYRKGDAFGLTIFGNEVLHWVPVTKDLSAIKHATPFLRPENLPHYFGGTQIGKALRECQKVLVQRKEGDRMIILVSDGFSADLGGNVAQEIASELRRDKITVYVVQAGEDPLPDEIHTIASGTGGEAFVAGDRTALTTVFRKIDQMQAAKLKPAGREYADFFAPVAIVGLAAGALHLVALLGVRYTPW
jgi:Ca-activated chloride channel family protein